MYLYEANLHIGTGYAADKLRAVRILCGVLETGGQNSNVHVHRQSNSVYGLFLYCNRHQVSAAFLIDISHVIFTASLWANDFLVVKR